MTQIPLRLGALDLCRVLNGSRPAEVIWESVELAPELESIGYCRYWLAEHHTLEVAHSSPEILTPIIAGITRTMKVGPAGILLRFHSPLKVAKDFRLLHTLYPGRIDLGLARGGVPENIEQKLRVSSRPDDVPYDRRIAELCSYLRGTAAEVQANPTGVAPPDLWILGRKSESVMLAAEHGTAFSLSLFLDPIPDPRMVEVIAAYRQSFQSSAELKQPKWSIAVAGVCAPTESEALSLASSAANAVVPTVIGTPTQCRKAFMKMQTVYETDEFVFLDVCGNYRDRLRSYRLLADALDLSAAG